MSIKNASTNPLDGYVIQGIKTIGNFDYYLCVDMEGDTVIARLSNADVNDTDVKYCVMPQTQYHFVDIAGAITEFWADPTGHTYLYLFQC